MGLAADIYSCLNTDWDISIIAKATEFQQNRLEFLLKPRCCSIAARYEGELEIQTINNLRDMCKMPFKIWIPETSEANAILSIRAIKKALHAKSVSGGWYHIDKFRIDINQQLAVAYMEGALYKSILNSELV